MKPIPKKMVVSDLDGTLLNSNREIANHDIRTLKALGNQDVLRVICTGRSYYSALKVLPPELPIDYLIFSSGAGIVHWESQMVEYSKQFTRKQSEPIAKRLIKQNCDFMLHGKVPKEHLFSYHQSDRENRDFDRRCEHYQDTASELKEGKPAPYDNAHFVVIEPYKDVDEQTEVFEIYKKLFPKQSVIRVTSPLDHESLWVEIHPSGVCKSSGAEWVAKKYDISSSNALAIGDDFNDVDLLQWAGKAYVVGNGAALLLETFSRVSSNNEGGFTEAVKKWLGDI